jgi:nitroreductase
LEAQDDSVETWDALRARRNVRQFTEEPVPDEALDRILEAGRRAPSAGNWQPWDFVLVTDTAQLDELAKVWQGAKHVAVSQWYSESEDAVIKQWLQATSRVPPDVQRKAG